MNRLMLQQLLLSASPLVRIERHHGEQFADHRLPTA